MLEKRQGIQRAARVTPEQIDRMLEMGWLASVIRRKPRKTLRGEPSGMAGSQDEIGSRGTDSDGKGLTRRDHILPARAS